MITELNIKQVEKISKALGDPYRLQIMDMISKRKDFMQCCEVSECFNLAQSTMSHHLKQLVDAELLVAEKEGRNLKFIINKEICDAYSRYVSSLGL